MFLTNKKGLNINIFLFGVRSIHYLSFDTKMFLIHENYFDKC